jgi:hypothetical protein
MSFTGWQRNPNSRAYATDVRSWWKLTYERSEGIRVLTHLRHWLCTAAMVLMPVTPEIKTDLM